MNLFNENINFEELRNKPHISKSQISTYLICPRKYYFNYVEKLKPEFVPEALAFGAAIHRVVAGYYRHLQNEKEILTKNTLLNDFEEDWLTVSKNEEIRYKDKSSSDILYEKGQKMLSIFHDNIKPRNIIAVEHAFAVNHECNPPLVGIFDLIESDDDGTLIVSELKTSGKKWTENGDNGYLDAGIYSLALRDAMQSKAGNILVRFDILTKTKTPSFEHLFVSQDDKAIRQTKNLITEISHAINCKAFYPSRGWQCKDCQFQGVCEEKF